jgi:hypothetical protein
MKRALFLFASLMVADPAAASTPPSQPASERARQALMPHSNDPIWTTLGRTVVTTDLARGVFTATTPPEVKALDGRDVTVSGYMLPLDPSPMISRFLLTRNTPVCPFCPPGQPNEVVEVDLDQFVKPTTEPVTVRGRFALRADAGQGLFFHLTRGELQ